MTNKPELMKMMAQLIETPSISCTHADMDMSNQPVINLLANWLNDLDFKVEIIPVSDGKSNLIATRGSGDRKSVV